MYRVLSRLALFALAPAPLAAQGDSLPAYREQQVMIPMRDGVKLNTRIYTPASGAPTLPFLVTRTPYGIAGSAAALGGFAPISDQERLRAV